MEAGPVLGKPVVHILQDLNRMTRETVQSSPTVFDYALTSQFK